MMKKKHIVLKGNIILLVVLAIVIAWIAFCGYQWSWGPFLKLHDFKTSKYPGNDKAYALENVQALENSPLNGKNLVFLGSSVTYGSAAKGVSFADYIAVRNGCSITKEAVSGTTLVDSGINSYISRLKKLDKNKTVDMFICQLSTNDATQKKPLGTISNSSNLADFNTKTVAGAIEYIIAYVNESWSCPVVFYTNPQYDSKEYAEMVTLLQEIADKWDIEIIDMWNDDLFCAISLDQKNLYMADPIHPTQAGYLEWWTPHIESALYTVLESE